MRLLSNHEIHQTVEQPNKSSHVVPAKLWVILKWPRRALRWPAWSHCWNESQWDTLERQNPRALPPASAPSSHYIGLLGVTSLPGQEWVGRIWSLKSSWGASFFPVEESPEPWPSEEKRCCSGIIMNPKVGPLTLTAESWSTDGHVGSNLSCLSCALPSAVSICLLPPAPPPGAPLGGDHIVGGEKATSGPAKTSPRLQRQWQSASPRRRTGLDTKGVSTCFQGVPNKFHRCILFF